MVLLALASLLLLAPSASAARAGSDPETSSIPPVVWQLAGVAEADSAPATIDDPARYTMQFLPDGRLAARFDCNQGSGGYTAVEGVLALNAAGHDDRSGSRPSPASRSRHESSPWRASRQVSASQPDAKIP